MIDGSEKRNRQLGFELQNSHVCEKRSKKKHKYLYISSTLLLQSLTCVCLGSLSYKAKEPDTLFLNNNFKI